MLGLGETYDWVLVAAGFAVIGVGVVLRRLQGRPATYPMVVLAGGLVAFALPVGFVDPDPIRYEQIAVRITELAVIVSLMGVGLKIDRPPSLRGWVTTWRLLGITMPLTIVGAAALGYFLLGFSLPAAVLLGAVLAPTDPVLASDVQVGEPLDDEGSDESHDDAEDEPRFALTSEAGLNDALAFPFTYAAVAMATKGTSPSAWLVEWLAVDVVYRIAGGVLLGLLGGWLVSLLVFRSGLPMEGHRDKSLLGVAALGATLLLYGFTEAAGAYGFLAVFVGALAIRAQERNHELHRSLHVFAEQSEQLLMAAVLFVLGGAVTRGILGGLSWTSIATVVIAIVVLRPLAGLVGLAGSRRLDRTDAAIAAFFGIRGVGTLYYLAYALTKADFAEARHLWAICALLVVTSVVVHGVAGAPVMAWRDRRRPTG